MTIWQGKVTFRSVALKAAVKAGLVKVKKNGYADTKAFDRFWELFLPELVDLIYQRKEAEGIADSQMDR